MVEFLQSHGHDSTHWSFVGDASATDEEICQHARERSQVLLTNDLDFPRILALTREANPSVIVLRGEPLTPEARGASLLKAISDCEKEIAARAIVTIDWSDRPRAHVLPIG